MKQWIILYLFIVGITFQAIGQKAPTKPPVKQTPVQVPVQIKAKPMDLQPGHISVSGPNEAEISGFQLGTGWAGYGDGPIAKMQRLSSGNIGIAYAAGTDQGLNFIRGLWVVMGPDMKQKQVPMIFSSQEANYINWIEMMEYQPGKIIIAYEYETYTENGSYPKGTHWVAIEESGHVIKQGDFNYSNVPVTGLVGMTMASNEVAGLTSVVLVYNSPNGIVLRRLSDAMYNSPYEETCTLPEWKVPGASQGKKLTGEWLLDFGDHILIKVKESLSISDWPVATSGIKSSSTSRKAMPFVLTDDWDFSNPCRVLNYPSTICPNPNIDPNQIERMIPLGNNFAIITYNPNDNSTLHIVDDKLSPIHDPYPLPKMILEGTIQHLMLEDGRLLLQMKSKHLSTAGETKHHISVYDPNTGIAMQSWGDPYRTSQGKEEDGFLEFLVDRSGDMKLLIQFDKEYSDWGKQKLKYWIIHYRP